MSRVVLVAMGVPQMIAATRHHGPGLRATHFASALLQSGHRVLLLCVLAEDEAAPTALQSVEQADSPRVADHKGLTIEFTTERELLTKRMRARVEAFQPDALVGVTVYAAALAVRLKLDVPLWADMFGDLMAEAQAKAARVGNDWSLVHFWTLMRGVLEGADRFSSVSEAQAHALIGQLGLAGRLSARTAGEDLVATIPCATETDSGRSRAEERRTLRQELRLAEEDLVLLIAGGVNTWFDVETAAQGVRAAMGAQPRIHLLITGGAIAGHDERSYADLLRGLEGRSERVHELGWVDPQRLHAAYAAADLALHIERPLYERRLGAENRVVEWMAFGLPCVTTGCSETGEALLAQDLARRCRVGDADDLARVLTELAQPLGEAWRRSASERGRRWVQAERDYLGTAAALRNWCAQPCFAGDRDGARLLRLGLLSQPETSVEMLEAYVALLPAHEILRRGVRWFGRRAWNATFGAAARWAAGRDGRRVREPGNERSRFRASSRRW